MPTSAPTTAPEPARSLLVHCQRRSETQGTSWTVDDPMTTVEHTQLNFERHVVEALQSEGLAVLFRALAEKVEELEARNDGAINTVSAPSDFDRIDSDGATYWL